MEITGNNTYLNDAIEAIEKVSDSGLISGLITTESLNMIIPHQVQVSNIRIEALIN